MSAWNSAVAATPIAVAVAHRDPLVQAGLRATLMSENDFAVSILPTDGPSLRVQADVVVADYDTALEWFSSPPASSAPYGPSARVAKVMVVSHRDRETEIRTALDLGVRGYLLLGCAVEEMVMGVRALSRGQLHLDRSAALRVAESLGRQVLTTRENEVLERIVEGKVNKTIGNELGITVGTVKAHVKAILAKLGARTRTEAAAIARRRGLTDLPN
ncbi:MAG: response regulator transcription factor [Comamonas sp.]|jgi:DNA-binding NarL/FixJ family response regulator|nr:response regulator transcription factor [Comamonas sp.]